MSNAKYVQCNCCGLWFVEFDTQRVQNGRRVTHYCRECVYNIINSKAYLRRKQNESNQEH